MDKLNDFWSKRSILDPKTGKFYNKYFYKRKPAHRVIVDTPKAKTLSGYVLIEKDLRSALIWLNHISEMLKAHEKYQKNSGFFANSEDRERFNLIKGLFVAALTFYGKCFSSCDGRRVKLEKRHLDEKFHKDHDDAMELRHNFAAHSGEKKFEQVAIVIALDTKRKATPYLAKELIQPDCVSKKDFERFLSLFEHAKHFTDKKISVLEQKIYKDDVLSKGAEYWYKHHNNSKKPRL
jgi:hypothetical protein